MNFPESLAPALHARIQEQADFVTEAYGVLKDGHAAVKMVRVYKRLDELMKESSNVIDCKAGCNYCCHYHVYVTPLEVFAIAEEVGGWPTVLRAQLLEALRRYVNQIQGLGIQKHRVLNIKCVFLSEGQCAIYSHRPLACRHHHSADVGVCRRTYDDPHSGEGAPRDPERLVASQAMITLHGLYHLKDGYDTDSYELHAALLEALTNKASYRRWKDRKAAFPSVADRVYTEGVSG